MPSGGLTCSPRTAVAGHRGFGDNQGRLRGRGLLAEHLQRGGKVYEISHSMLLEKEAPICV